VDVDEFGKECDVVFIATPDGLAMKFAPGLLAGGAKVIDYAADFRFQDASVYEKHYPIKHTQRELLKQAAYGLPEFNAQRIAEASLIGNPGCFPTAVVLGAAPLFKESLVQDDFITANCLTGASGAGRKANLGLILPELAGNVRPYKVATHRHQPEMAQVLSTISSHKARVCFIPELIPIDRGIIATITARLSKSVSLEDLLSIYNKTYSEAPFVRIGKPGELPELKRVVGSNHCDIGMAVAEEDETVIVFSCIDNLVKGLAGQAVQNMNLMFSLSETTGLV
jgi:N-acetyl-gamma-glutamyl-phosphate reductase